MLGLHKHGNKDRSVSCLLAGDHPGPGRGPDAPARGRTVLEAPRGRALSTRARAALLVRVGLVAALAAVLSGAPRAAVAAAGVASPCAQDCGGSTPDFGCPPNCSLGACARIVPGVVDEAPEFSGVVPGPRRYEREDARPPKAPFSDGVFHPPTR